LAPSSEADSRTICSSDPRTAREPRHSRARATLGRERPRAPADDPARRRQLLDGSAAPSLATAFLLHRALPVTGILRPPAALDGIVIQTTPYTCAPAAIATLARFTGLDSGMTERDAVRLAGTTREGTNAWAELRALRALGLTPEFRRHLTADSLRFLGPAVLHVNEPVLATTIRHAVALLAVDTAARTITVGNPLRGRQVKRFADLGGYWFGEAVVLGMAFQRLPPERAAQGERRR